MFFAEQTIITQVVEEHVLTGTSHIILKLRVVEPMSYIAWQF